MDVVEALEKQRTVERDFVEVARQNETAPRGWPAALVMFHLGMWRERMRNALTDLAEGREPARPPASVDEANAVELADGIGTPLADAAGRTDHLLGEIIDLYRKLGDRPMSWYAAINTTEAVLRNSYLHPRTHLYQYFRENGEDSRALDLFESAYSDLRDVGAPPLLMHPARYNLACVRAVQGRTDEAIALLREVLPVRPDLRSGAGTDADLAALRDDSRFQELIRA